MSPKEQVNRRALIRQYKETRRPMGVFRVHNTGSDKSFVGSSRDRPSVLNRERFWLNSGGHPNRALQEDWNRLGPGAFVFETLDTLSPGERSDSELADDLALLERLWLEKLTPYDEKGYNAPPAPATGRQK